MAEEDMLALSVSHSAPTDATTLDGQEAAEADPVELKETMERQAGRRQSHSKVIEEDLLDLANKTVPAGDVEAAVDELEEAQEEKAAMEGEGKDGEGKAC